MQVIILKCFIVLDQLNQTKINLVRISEVFWQQFFGTLISSGVCYFVKFPIRSGCDLGNVFLQPKEAVAGI